MANRLSEEEMERQAEIEMEWELIEWRHSTKILEDTRKSLKDDGIDFDDGIDTEDSFRIRVESSMEF